MGSEKGIARNEGGGSLCVTALSYGDDYGDWGRRCSGSSCLACLFCFVFKKVGARKRGKNVVISYFKRGRDAK